MLGFERCSACRTPRTAGAGRLLPRASAQQQSEPCCTARPAATGPVNRLYGQIGLLAAAGLAGAPAWADVDGLAAPAAPPKIDNGWLNPIVDSLNFVLGSIEGFYESVGLPNAYGWSIVTLTAFVKLLTLPLTKQQVESSMATQNLKPRLDAIKERYGKDKKKVQKETSRLYEEAKVNPLAGCGPSILQIPIFIGLYRSLNNVAKSGTLDNEGFLWIPSLAGAPARTPHTSR
jgi:YidC/Oxa1 family membrane protein insertase